MFSKFLIPLFLTITISVSAQKIPSWATGNWTGVGYQSNALIKSVWPIELIFDTSNEISVNYPSFPCSGNWQVVSADNCQVVFKEIITEGADKCENNGKVIITKIDKDHISVAYFYEYQDDIVAFSVLTRK